MKTLTVEPKGWPLRYYDCPPGLFIYVDTLCFRPEYDDDSFVVESGEAFWGGVPSKEARAELIVQPCIAVWHKTESD